MAIDLPSYATGDIDYIAKLNSSMAMIESAINSLQTAIGGSASSYTIPIFIDALFHGQTSLIGLDSYVPVPTGTNLNVSAGAAYKATIGAVVGGSSVVIPFAGQTPSTYYIVVDVTGTPVRSDSDIDAIYSVEWSGSAFGDIIRRAKVLYNVIEEDDGRKSLVLGVEYDSLDARLEAAETKVGEVEALKMRRVCLFMDGGSGAIALGVKATIQCDFAGTIVGWSVTSVSGDPVGDLTVEVSKRASAAPPSSPVIPDPVTDKISASAPIFVTGAASASGDPAAVSTWTTAVALWDVLQFKVTAATLKRATIVVWVQEA